MTRVALAPVSMVESRLPTGEVTAAMVEAGLPTGRFTMAPSQTMLVPGLSADTTFWDVYRRGTIEMQQCWHWSGSRYWTRSRVSTGAPWSEWRVWQP